jgi:hypothetical protein
MSSPGLVESIAASPATPIGPAVVDLAGQAREGSTARTELLHRHLVARIEAARGELRQLQEGDDVPEELVAWLGAVVAERRRELEASRAAARDRAAALVRAADARAAELIESAETEARVLRAVATWLRGVPLARASLPGRATAAIGPRRRAEQAP